MKSWWTTILPFLRFLVVTGTVLSLIQSILFPQNRTTPLLLFSEYGLVIFVRMLLQLLFAHKNNQQIQKIMRNSFIESAEQELGFSLSIECKKKLLQSHDFREFRYELKRILTRHQLTWQQLLVRIFSTMGFSSEVQPPPVFIEIPIFRPESFAEVQATLHSLQSQTYPAIKEILVCFNDPSNQKMKNEIDHFIKQHSKTDSRLAFVSLPTSSKRSAMHAGFSRHIQFFNQSLNYPHSHSISVNIDGDTQVDPDAVTLGVLLLLLDPETAAITSNVEIRNPHHNWLSLITAARYKSANVVERSAQSWFHSVRCMSGPFMMFWTKNLASITPRGQSIASEWVNETFLNVKVEPGDDRSLTVRHNEQGFGVRFHPDILVTTDCPLSWQRWCKQQLRWMRSCNRNFIISLPFLFQMPLYIIFDDLYLFFFPFLLLITTCQLLIETCKNTHSISQAFFFLLPYFLILFGLQLFKSLHLAWTQKNWKFLYLACYFLIYFRYLIWLRIISFFTITQSEWAGRTTADFVADQIALKGGFM